MASDLTALQSHFAEGEGHPGHAARSRGVHGHRDPVRREPSEQRGGRCAPLPERAIDGGSDDDAGRRLARPVEAAGFPAPVSAGGRGGGICVPAGPVGREPVPALQVADDALRPPIVVGVAHYGAVAAHPQGHDVRVAPMPDDVIGVVPEPGHQFLAGDRGDAVVRLRGVGSPAEDDVRDVPQKLRPEAGHGTEASGNLGGRAPGYRGRQDGHLRALAPRTVALGQKVGDESARVPPLGNHGEHEGASPSFDAPGRSTATAAASARCRRSAIS